MTALRMHRVLSVKLDRAAALERFVDDLSADDEATLRRLLGDATDTTVT